MGGFFFKAVEERDLGRGSAGPCLRSQEGLGKGIAFALRTRAGFVRLQCSLRHGPAAARWGLCANRRKDANRGKETRKPGQALG